MENKHMTIKIFDKNDSPDAYVLWSPVENNEVVVVCSKGWLIQSEGGPCVTLEEDKKYVLSKNEKYKIHKGTGELVLGVIRL